MTPSDTAHPEGERELLACPFCGSRGYLTVNKPSGQEEVRCRNSECVARGPLARSNESAIAAWNTRPVVRPQGEEGLWRPISEAREDLHSHRSAWRHALELALERADYPTEDADDRSYWRHELTVFDRVFTALSNQGKPSS